MKPEIKVWIDEGGIFRGVFVSPELKDSDVELIDFVTEDGEEYENAEKLLNDAFSRVDAGELVEIVH